MCDATVLDFTSLPFRNESCGNASGVKTEVSFALLPAVSHVAFDPKWIFKILHSRGLTAHQPATFQDNRQICGYKLLMI